MQETQKKAYFEPFQKFSGIKVNDFVGSDFTKIKAMVDTNTVEWDLAQISHGSVLNLQKHRDYFELIDYELIDPGVGEDFRFDRGLEMLIWAQVMAYGRSRPVRSRSPHPERWRNQAGVRGCQIYHPFGTADPVGPDDSGRRRQPFGLVGGQRLWHWMPHQQVAQTTSIQDRLGGAVRFDGVHRMGSVAQQRNPNLCPPRQRVAVAHWILEYFPGLLDQPADIDEWQMQPFRQLSK